MEVQHFETIQPEMMRRIEEAIYCIMATVDRRGRPRTRILHLVWDGPIGYVITDPDSLKAKHLAENPHVSLAYYKEIEKPLYIEAAVEWITDDAGMQRVWDLIKNTPPPIGFDPEPFYGDIHGEHFGVLKFTPWRIDLAELFGESMIWRHIEYI